LHDAQQGTASYGLKREEDPVRHGVHGDSVGVLGELGLAELDER
jgi:hypothetical protein